jgi:hypothetical protein
MTGHKIALRGFRIGKGGKVERDQRRLDVSARLRQKSSKRVRVSRRVAKEHHARAARVEEQAQWNYEGRFGRYHSSTPAAAASDTAQQPASGRGPRPSRF